MAVDQLSSLSRVKAWLGAGDSDAADPLLTTLIKSASTAALQFCNRESFSRRTFRETYDGYSKDWIVLHQPNVLSITQLSVHPGQIIPAASGDGISTPHTNGYAYRDGRLVLFGRYFPNGRGAIYVEYDAGFSVTDEPHTVPAADELEVDVDRFRVVTEKVTLADGTVLTEVSGDPAALQYSMKGERFLFNSAQAGAAVLISYGFAPDDVVQAVTEWVGERYKYKDRIGHQSKSLGGQETVTFSANRMPEAIAESLRPYRRVV